MGERFLSRDGITSYKKKSQYRSKMVIRFPQKHHKELLLSPLKSAKRVENDHELLLTTKENTGIRTSKRSWKAP